MRKTIVTGCVLALLALATSGQEKPEKVLLRFKTPESGALAYRTSLDPVKPGEPGRVKLDLFAGLDREGLSEEGKKELEAVEAEVAKLFKTLIPPTANLTTLLRRTKEDRISVMLVMGKLPDLPQDATEKERLAHSMQKLMSGQVQLRAEIDDSGAVTSFYIARNQRNVVALFLELPKEPVGPGDTWSIDARLTTLGHGFICEEANRENRVRLVSLDRTEDGDTVAAIDYRITERVKGVYQQGAAPGGTPVEMSVTFVARGEFLVEKGTWRRFRGLMGIKSSGMMNSDVQKRFSLEPLESIPEEILKLK